jgi:hypothetical protein
VVRTWIGAAVLSAFLVAAGAARADPIRILVAASHSRGAPGELPLLHAAEDVEHVEGVLTTLGDVRPADVITVVDPTPAALNAAIDRAGALAATHAPEDVTFLFYFSGHGDRDRIHLGGETVAMADLTTRIRAVPAALRMLVTDACRNYPTRSKGVTTEPGFAIESAADHPADGVIWLFSAGEGEPALESDELRGGLFTYYWVNALRGAGDANGDGRVTLAESYDFAYSQTLLRSSRGSGVLQHPSAVFDLHEAAPIVLTSTAGSTALLRFPQAADSRYLVYAVGSRAVLGELWGSAERSVAFALPPGRYLVQRMGGAGSAGVDLALSAGESRALSAAEFRAVPEEQLAAKGGTVVLRPNEIGVDFEGAASGLSTFGEQLSFRYAYHWDAWAFSFAMAGGHGTQRTLAENVTLASAGAAAVVERRVALGPLGLSLGAGARADVIRQNVERTDAGRVAAAGYPTTQQFTALAPGPVALAHLRAPIGPTVWIELTAQAGVLFPHEESGAGAVWTASAGLGTGLQF